VVAPGRRSGEGEGEGEGGAHRFRLEGARSIAWVATTQPAVAAAVGAVRVESYYFPGHERAGRAALATAAAALHEFARRFGPYPYRTLTVVEADFVDGLVYCGPVFVGGHYYAAYDGSPRTQLTAIAAHETAHQWWHCRVGNDPAAEPWLDEALATFSEVLFYEARHPAAAAWWWETRVGRFRPRGRVEAPAGEFASLRAYIDAVYLRGALLLRDLRHGMGPAAFDAALLDYATRFDGRVATAEDLWGVLERHSGAPLEAVRARYRQP
jgi:aminopeptidase N